MNNVDAPLHIVWPYDFALVLTLALISFCCHCDRGSQSQSWIFFITFPRHLLQLFCKIIITPDIPSPFDHQDQNPEVLYPFSRLILVLSNVIWCLSSSMMPCCWSNLPARVGEVDWWLEPWPGTGDAFWFLRPEIFSLCFLWGQPLKFSCWVEGIDYWYWVRYDNDDDLWCQSWFWCQT